MSTALPTLTSLNSSFLRAEMGSAWLMLASPALNAGPSTECLLSDFLMVNGLTVVVLTWVDREAITRER